MGREPGVGPRSSQGHATTPLLTVLAAALALASTVARSWTRAAGPRADPVRGSGGGPSVPRLDIDPRSYYEDYRSPEGEEAAALKRARHHGAPRAAVGLGPGDS